ncbi:NAD(P)-dependent oxidoreductase [Chloroflexota bacterium]
MKMEKQKVGFIGLGRMGQIMADRLFDAGFPLTILDLVTSKMVELGKRGAKVASSPREVAAQSDITITMVTDDAALEAVGFGENGTLAGLRPGSVLIDMGTAAPKHVSSQIAAVAEERGAMMLRAPVSGTTNWAAEGALTIFASGDKQTFEKCQKVFEVLGRKMFYLGVGEEALYYKLVVNIMVMMTSQMMAEAMVFGQLAGLDTHKMVEVISGSVVASPILCHRLERVADRNFTGGASVHMAAKDLLLALTAGRQLGAPMPTTALVHQFFSSAEAMGMAEFDLSAMFLLIEELAGRKL